jgi:hypothetical protein
MIYPPRIKVGARYYELNFLEEGELEQLGRVGQTSYRDGRIDISRGNRTMDAIAETVMHECMHALFCDSGIDIDAEHEENIISVLSPRIMSLMCDNPDLVHALIDGVAPPDDTD